MQSAPAPLIVRSPRALTWWGACLGLLLLVGGSRQLEAADLAPETGHPTGYQTGVIAIECAQLIVSPDQTIEKGTIVVRDGRIEAVGTDVEIPAGAERIDGAGLLVYPGFIDAGAEAQLKPAPSRTEAARPVLFEENLHAATRPDNRRGLHPERSLVDQAFPDADAQAVRRQTGVTDAHLVSFAPLAGGQTALVTLSGLPPRESVLWTGRMTGLQLRHPPELVEAQSHLSYPLTLMGATAHLRQTLLDAQHYALHRELARRAPNKLAPPHEDPALIALAELLAGNVTPLFILPGSAGRDELDRALDFSQEFGLQPILHSGTQPYAALDRIVATHRDLIVSLDVGEKPKFSPRDREPEQAPGEPRKPSDKLAGNPSEDKNRELKVSQIDGLHVEVEPPPRYQADRLQHWKRRAEFPGKLAKRGVRIAFSSRGLKSPDEWLDQIRVHIEHGLTESQAVAALTANAAQILSVDDQLGTLHVGKRGHLTVLSGRLSEPGTQVRYLLIDGIKYEYHTPKPTESPSTTPPAAQLSGSWVVRVDNGPMPTEAILDLAQEGHRLTGTFSSEAGKGRLASGSISGADLRFTVEIGAGDKTIALKFTGTVVDKSQLKGTLESAFGAPAPWQANRPGDETTLEPPVKLSLDDSGPPEKTPAVEKTAKSSATANRADPARAAIAPAYPTELESDRRPRSKSTGGNLLIRGGTILTGTGEVLENAALRIEGGRITAMGPDLTAPEGVRVIDATGRFLIPGMIDTHSHIMIEGGVNEHSQSVVCEVRIQDTLLSRDAREYRALAGGLTTARLFHGSANVIGGQDAVVKLQVGSTAKNRLVTSGHQGVKFALGENVKRKSGRFPNTRMGVEAVLQRAFYEAIDYRRRWMEYDQAQQAAPGEPRLPPRRDLRLEELVDLIEGRSRIHSHCYRADEILMLLRTAEGLGIRVQSLQHVLEGYKIAPEIAKHGASCSTFADWWAYKIEAYDATPYNTSMLTDAGINTVVKSDDPELMRQMNLEAAKSLKYGNMPLPAALQLVTRNAARELGLQDRLGTLEIGRDGDVAIYNGHPFSPFSRVEMTIIEGEVLFQRDKQPTAMSKKAIARTQTAPAWTLAAPEARSRSLTLPTGTSFALVGATVHPVDQPTIIGGTIVVRAGRIVSVAADPAIPTDLPVLNASGRHIYPGLIDAGTTLGIAEIEQVDPTQDDAEIGRYQPDLRAGIAVNVDSELVPVARAGGITAAFLRPQGGTIAGQCSLIQTAGWTPEEMVRVDRGGLSLNWPTGPEDQSRLTRFIQECRRYDIARSEPATARRVLQDPRYEAMRPYVTGQKRIFIEAHSRQQIAGALVWAEEQKLSIVITGGTDAWKLAAALKSRQVPVIVGPVMREPVEPWDPYDAPYANPGRLYESGVTFCIRSDNASNSRNAPLEAGRAVAFGLPEDAALKSVTLYPAQLLGIAAECGSITPGKRADLIITDGSPLLTTTQIHATIVAGQAYLPESRQTRLYEKYRARLSQHQAP
ncbi:MAG: hypothetical protein DWH91_10725 [Planctomycetota bacterium]|nr:MAG: hypothetical protein DWH91_10725 [Planctomycetota bacterium]